MFTAASRSRVSRSPPRSAADRGHSGKPHRAHQRAHRPASAEKAASTVQQKPARVQPALVIGARGSRLEREADDVAARIVSAPESGRGATGAASDPSPGGNASGPGSAAGVQPRFALAGRISAQAEEEQVSAQAEDEQVSAQAEEEQASPQAEEEQVGAQAEDEQASPQAEEEQVSAQAEDEQVSPQAEEEQVSAQPEEGGEAATFEVEEPMFNPDFDTAAGSEVDAEGTAQKSPVQSSPAADEDNPA